ncbi:MAG: hypothetical protein V4691_08830 [Pseudomonadota bacterium]
MEHAIAPCLLQMVGRDVCIVQMLLDEVDAIAADERPRYMTLLANGAAVHGTIAQREKALALVESAPSNDLLLDRWRLTLLLSLGKIDEAFEEIKSLTGSQILNVSLHLPQDDAIRLLVREGRIDDAVALYKKSANYAVKKTRLVTGNAEDYSVPTRIVAALLLDDRVADARHFIAGIDSKNVFNFDRADADSYVSRYEAFIRDPQGEAKSFFRQQSNYFERLETEQKLKTGNILRLEAVAKASADIRDVELEKFESMVIKESSYTVASLSAKYYLELLFEPQSQTGYRLTWELFIDRCVRENTKRKMRDVECIARALTRKIDKIYGGAETFLVPRYAQALDVALPANMWSRYRTISSTPN